MEDQAAEHKQPSFLEKNPSGVLPVLQLDDGTYIAESTAITEYLDNLDGDPRLTGKTPREKALIHMMQKRAESELLDAVGDYFHHATPGLGADLQTFKSPEWAGRQEWGNRQRDRALEGMKYFDTVLREHSFEKYGNRSGKRDHSFVAGDAFSMADITVFAGLMFADAAGIVVPEDHSALNAWRAKIADLPSVKNRSGQMFVADDLRRLGF